MPGWLGKQATSYVLCRRQPLPVLSLLFFLSRSTGRSLLALLKAVSLLVQIQFVISGCSDFLILGSVPFVDSRQFNDSRQKALSCLVLHGSTPINVFLERESARRIPKGVNKANCTAQQALRNAYSEQLLLSTKGLLENHR